MKVPYGLSNFKMVISEGYAYVDKTAYIAQLEENGQYQMLLRPRRFGKSLFISMLEYYYGVQYQDEFEDLFGKLSIGQNPTKFKNRYQVLFMEFTGIATESGYEQLYQDFNRKVANQLSRFLQRYAYSASDIAAVEAEHSPQSRMEAFFRVTEKQKIYLIIDEYDHFANAVLAQDQKLFQTIVGKGGFVRSFYETFKAATQQGIVERIFITGVTALMLDSLTSGFNISENLTFDEGFNAALGFTKAETEQLLLSALESCQPDQEALMSHVTEWYDGYRFHPDAVEHIYNPDMVLYFIKNFNLKTCQYPEKMLDENIASDYRKIMALFQIGNPEANYAVLNELVHQGSVTARQQRKFELDKDFNRDDFISLLAYMGFVTVSGRTLTQTRFGIPNHVIEELYFQYFKVELEHRNRIQIPDQSLSHAIEVLALENDIAPLVQELETVLRGLSNRDAIKMDEKHIKVILLTLLYQFPVWFIQSERELNRKYPDILLLERSPFPVKYQHLIELKYSKKGDGASGWALKRQEGIEQVQDYLQLAAVQVLSNLSAWVLVSDGERIEVVRV